jgi:hypothetical protein
MVETEEVKPWLTFDKLYDPCFLGLWLQAEPVEKRGQLGQGGLSLAPVPADHQQIVGIAGQAPIGRTPVPVQPVEVHIAEHG